MEHLVRFTSAEGRDGFHSANSLDEAVKFVERLRNSEEVDNVRLYRLQEIPIEFKAYFKVEVRPGEGGPGQPGPTGETPGAETEDVEASLPAPEPPSGESERELVASPSGLNEGANRKLFGRG